MSGSIIASADVLIIGGGVIGLLTARELKNAGLAVSLLERGEVGQESSWAGGGILSPLCPWRTPDAITALSRWSQQVYPDLTSELRSGTGIDPEWIRSGLLMLPCEDTELVESWCATQLVSHEWLSAAEIGQLEPRMMFREVPALYLPEIAQVRNPRLLRALRADVERRGVTILEHQEVLDIAAGESRIEWVVTPQGRFTAAAYVVTAGAWSRNLGDNLWPSVHVEPVRGQMLAFAADPKLLHRIVVSQDCYAIPRRDGVILVGSTVEYTAFDKSTTPAAERDLTAFARSALPDLREARLIRHWAGLRPGSPSGIPYIFRHPAYSNLLFNCGHFRNGFVTAPASARLAADLVLERAPLLPPEPYDLDAVR